MSSILNRSIWRSLPNSLLLIIPTAQGLVLAADRSVRIYAEDGSTLVNLDCERKLSRVGETTALAVLGMGTCFHVMSESDIGRLVWRYFQKNGTTGSIYDHSARLSKFIKRSLKVHLRKCPHKSGEGFNYTVFVLALFHFNAVSDSIEQLQLSLHYDADNARMWTEKVEIIDQEEHCIVSSIGRTAVLEELSYGQKPSFDDLRKYNHVKDFLHAKKPVSEISQELALKTSAQLVLDTSMFLHLVESDKYPVSDSIDAALLSKDGFQWLCTGAKCWSLI